MVTTKILTLAPYIEHTLLKPETTRQQIEKLCEEAIQYSFQGVCVNSCYVPLSASRLKGEKPLLVAVVGFPLGAGLSEAKSFEAQLAAQKGAQEIDMVINIGFAKEGLWKEVETDIRAVVKSVDIPVKVILETGFLTNEEIKRACHASESAGALFVKTCTGFAPGVATVEHVTLMRASVAEHVQVKASGGIKTAEQAFALLSAGATRLGTSSGVQLVTHQSISSHSY